MAIHVDTGTMRGPITYQSYNLDHLGLVAAMIDELGRVEIIDSVIVQDHEQRVVSVGRAVKAMILNGLGFSHRALYLTPHFFENKPVARLLGTGIEARHLNDDTLGKALDRLYAYGVEDLYGLIAAVSVRKPHLYCRFGHLDSTSLHVDGTYNSEQNPPDGVIQITRGYSRDHRPDLNQWVIQFICENQAGIPLLMKPLSGNSEDKTGFRETLDAHLNQLNQDVAIQYYVFDSAGFVRETLIHLGDTRWISRVPETITLARQIVDAVAPDLAMTGNPLSYRSLGVEHAGIRQRWVVVRTASARQRAQNSVQREYLKKGGQECKAFHSLRKQTFCCEADARAALEQFKTTLSYTALFEEKVLAVATHAKRGRPTADQKPGTLLYRIEGQVASLIDDGRRQQKIDRKSCFMVATNELDPAALSDEELIETYTQKQQKVERGFRFLKDPLFMASTVFLKSAERIMALAMITTLSLLVYSALEHRIRESLKMHQKTFPNQKGQPIHHPTARWVFQFFTGIHLLVMASMGEIVLNLKAAHQTLLALLGEHFVALYADSG